MKEEKKQEAGWGREQIVNQEETGKKWILKSKEEMTIPKVSAWSNQFVGSE